MWLGAKAFEMQQTSNAEPWDIKSCSHYTKRGVAKTFIFDKTIESNVQKTQL